MHFAKLQASGNDFIIVDNREGELEVFINGIDVEEFVRRVCNRNRGVGADGLILIEHPEDPLNSFRWRFFNSDGSVAEMCGNGSRCAVRFCYEKGIADEEVSFETLAGVIKARVYEGGRVVRVQLTPPSEPSEKKLKLNGSVIEGVFINTGVPHFIVPVNDIEEIDVVGLGRRIRFHGEFEPKGTNVNFLEPLGADTIRIRTYERGVESETLACGTGATACALVSWWKGYINEKPVKVITKGGDVLMIDFTEDFKEVFLQGRAVKICEGTIDPEVLTS